MTKSRRTWIALLFLSALWPSLAQAVEITPFVGYRFGGDITTGSELDFFGPFDLGLDIEDGESLGLVIDFRVAGNLFFELQASRQETTLREDLGLFDPGIALLDLDLDYYHAGLLYQWVPGQVRPFVAGSLGVTRVGPQAADLDDAYFPSVSVGGGVKLAVNDAFGVRFEVRSFGTWLDDGEEIFCVGFSCFRTNETYLVQYEARAGLSFSF